MKILVMSSDKNKDTFELFHYCMETNWPEHPEVIYSTETIFNPYYKTICKNYPLEIWSKRIRETIQEVDDDNILLMCDDIFIRQPVDNSNILNLQQIYIAKGVACLHFEQSFVATDINLFDDNWYKCTSWIRRSNMCALWNKKDLLSRFNADLDPWALENLENTGDCLHLISKDKDIFDWGKGGTGYRCWGIFRGVWSMETVKYARSVNIELDLKRGIIDHMPTKGEDAVWKSRLNTLKEMRNS